ncbi:hypothetical protein Q1W73_16405 [Asticcacaulis sp. ZE23SCel15]|uniref:hypothetical protein n=1 Tax=Asticcacaulis sp. ZE23SCel15 TaxID=3059027 RepID=UPI00265DAA06|nr:hypothetical protein [Asticcacaulis sp. ZE23SCel15]WKL57225.1 hypothetical protein Q1W73_16405 [Asticcacaulis sp. ZE23SCel15]
MTDKSFLSEPWIAKSLTVAGAHAAAFAGAVMSLAFVGQLSVWGRVVAVCVGFVTAVFVAPALSVVVGHLFFDGAMPDEVRSGIMFLLSLSAMTILPPLLAFLKKLAGDPLGVLSALLPRGPSPSGPDQGGGA